MDDVGQTLLNWASAFGTQEMVRKKKPLSGKKDCRSVNKYLKYGFDFCEPERLGKHMWQSATL